MAATAIPALYTPDKNTAERVLEFFAAKIWNKNARRNYALAAGGFAAWCENRGIFDLALVCPLHVEAYIEELTKTLSAPSVKLHLAAIRFALRSPDGKPGGAAKPGCFRKGSQTRGKEGKDPGLIRCRGPRAPGRDRDGLAGGPPRSGAYRDHGLYLRPGRGRNPDAGGRRILSRPAHLGAASRERGKAC